MTTTTIYLLRHGETEWNVDARLQGQGDSPLTSRGIEQARRFGRALARLIESRDGLVLVSSPLGRTMSTMAEVAAGLGLGEGSWHADDRLKELSFGTWGGQLRESVFAGLPDPPADPHDYSWFFRAPGGETMEAMRLRIAAFLDDLPPARTLVIVSHGITGQVLRGLYLGLSSDEIMRQDQPQDAIYRLANGMASRIDVADVIDVA